jgi:hypothetical protein
MFIGHQTIIVTLAWMAGSFYTMAAMTRHPRVAFAIFACAVPLLGYLSAMWGLR